MVGPQCLIRCPSRGKDVLLIIVLSTVVSISGMSLAVGSNAFSWPSHTHQNQPGCRAQRQSLMRLVCCFLSPLCKETVVITVASSFIATIATPKKQSELHSAVVQEKGEKGISPHKTSELPGPLGQGLEPSGGLWGIGTS